jgi:hypothetical protein
MMADLTNYFVSEDFESHINKTYSYNFPLNEVFRAFTDLDLLLKIYNYKIQISNSSQEPFIEEEGSEISILINSNQKIILRITKITKSQYFCLIKAKSIQYPLDLIPFSVDLEFYWDSREEVTIFNGSIYLAKSTSQDKIISLFKKYKIFPAEEIDEYLKNNVKNLEQDESILINTSIDKIINFVSQLQNIQLFINIPNTEIINEGNNILKVVDKSNNNFIRLLKREKRNDESNFTMYLENFDSLVLMPLQSMQIQLIKVNDNSTLIIYKHIVLDYIPYNALKSNSANKQKILKKIKKILEKGKE